MSARLSMVKCEDEEMSRRAVSDEKDGGAKGGADSLAARSCSLFEFVERLKQWMVGLNLSIQATNDEEQSAHERMEES